MKSLAQSLFDDNDDDVTLTVDQQLSANKQTSSAPTKRVGFTLARLLEASDDDDNKFFSFFIFADLPAKNAG
jgi:hypothetical protein